MGTLIATLACAWNLLFVLTAPATQGVDGLERRLPALSGHERMAALARLLELSRDESVPAVEDYGHELLRLLRETPDPDLEVRTWLDLSWFHSRHGEAATGLSDARRALDLAVQQGDSAARARAQYHIALARWYESQPDEALAVATMALALQKECGTELEQATTLTLIGAILRSRSEYEASISSHFEALMLAEEVGDDLAIARSRNNIGLVYWKIDQHDRALGYLNAVVPIYRAAGKEQQLAAALSNVGLIYVELGRPTEALVLLQEARELLNEYPASRSLARVLSNLGFAHATLADNEAALKFYQQALALREELGDRWGASRSLGTIAEVHLQAGRCELATREFSRALEHAEAVGARDEQAELHAGLARAYEGMGRSAEALRELRRHQAIAAELNEPQTLGRIADLEAEMAIASKERELSRQQSQQQFLLLGSLVLLAVIVGLVVLYRARARSLVAVRNQHEQLQSTTEKLRESEQRYRSVFDDAVVPRLILDLERRCLVDANEPLGRLLGRPAGALVGAPWDEVAPDWLARTIVGFAGGERSRIEEWPGSDGQPRWSEIWVTPLSLGERPCAVVTIHDVTEQHRVERERTRIDKLESIGVLAGGIAHDFNNALAAIMGHVSLARYKVDAEAGVTDVLTNAENAIEQAAHLTKQLLAFAQGGAPRRELQDVRKLLWDSVNFGLSGSNVQVEFDISPDLWSAKLDAGQFKQAISNLVINADQAMADGGRLVVRARNLRARSEVGPGVGPGPYVVIEIQDFGPGIPAAIQDNVFEPYFTTKELGSGLGLSTAFAVVSRHEGWMEFSGPEGQGTTFSIYFPASSERPAAILEEPGLELSGSGSILVMDDDPVVQRVFAATLTELGYQVEIVGDGESALERWFAVKDSGSGFDAVIMDLTIPGGMGGKKAMAELRRRDPEARGIVASGYSRDPVMSNYSEAGFQGALSKPFTVVGLGRLLHQVLGDAGRSVESGGRPGRTSDPS